MLYNFIVIHECLHQVMSQANKCKNFCTSKKFAFIQYYSSSVILREFSSCNSNVIIIIHNMYFGLYFGALNAACNVAIATA